MSVLAHKLRSRLRGPELKACVGQLAAAERNNLDEEKAQYFYFKPNESSEKQRRRVHNPRVVNFVWPLARDLGAALRKNTFKLCFARGTCHSKKEECRERFPADLKRRKTLSGCDWNDSKYTDLASLNEAHMH